MPAKTFSQVPVTLTPEGAVSISYNALVSSPETLQDAIGENTLVIDVQVIDRVQFSCSTPQSQTNLTLDD